MSLLVARYIRDLFIILEKGNIESDVYNNALSISNIIDKLYKESNLSKFDIDVLDFIASGYSYSDVAKTLSISRQRVTTSFKDSCNKISFILGGDFTDAGFMDRFAKGNFSA
jgi:DNA-binding CsgD family transcriptional regulator